MASLLQSRRVFFAIVVLGLFAMAARGVTDPDVWWHLRTGQLTLQNGAVFRTDPYSFTRFGQPWVNHEWLFDTLLFALYRITGWGGLIVVFAAIAAASFALVFRRASAEAHVTGMVVVLSAVASSPLWGCRPQMVSLLFASLLLALRDGSRERPRRLWWALPMVFVWINLHAGYALGIALLILFLLGDLLEVASGSAQWGQTTARIRITASVIAACLMLVPLNPYGTKMYAYPLATLRSSSMRDFIVEWFSPNFHQVRYQPFLLLLLVTLTATAFSPRRLRPADLLLMLASAAAALVSVRHIPIYAVVAAPLLSHLIQPWFGTRHPLSPTARLSGWKFAFNGVMVLSVLALAWVQVGKSIRQQPTAEAANFPAAAVSFLAQKRPAGPLFHAYDWGGYLIWKLYPECLVYIDGRADVYGDGFMREFADSYYLLGKWKEPLDRWRVSTVLLPPDAPVLAVLERSKEWTRVYADQQSVILTRNRSQIASTISN